MSVSDWLWSWWRKPDPVAVSGGRWIVLDVETSGLDPRRDRLLAIAAIGLRVDWPTHTLAIDLGDTLEVVLQQNVVSGHDNIVLHGIGAQQQRDGVPPDKAMAAFADFVGSAPLLAFHAPFDQMLIGRYARHYLGQPLPNPWVDIAHLCSAACPVVQGRSLDHWLAHFDLHCGIRHQAASDTLAECELLLRIWPLLAHQCRNWQDLRRLATRQRWLMQQ